MSIYLNPDDEDKAIFNEKIAYINKLYLILENSLDKLELLVKETRMNMRNIYISIDNRNNTICNLPLLRINMRK